MSVPLRGFLLGALPFLLAVAVKAESSDNFLLRGGKHEGVFLRGEFGLYGRQELERRKPDTIKIYDVNTATGFGVGLGWAVVPRWIAHLQFEWAPVSMDYMVYMAVGPALTWYTPMANTFVTGHWGYARMNQLGGDQGWRWSLAIGKEFLFAEQYGIGIKLSHGGLSWDEGRSDYPKWKMQGTQINLVATIN